MKESDAIRTIRLNGELDIGRKAQIRQALQPSNRDRAVLVDLSEVTYADSVALTELLRFCVEAERAAIPVALVVAAPQFARIVEYAGLAGAFKTFDDRGAALTYLLERAKL